MTRPCKLSGIQAFPPASSANDHVNFTLEKGGIHAVLGRRRRQKFTLDEHPLRVVRPDEGENRINGRRHNITTPHEAIALGIGMVHQHFIARPPADRDGEHMLGQEVADERDTRPRRAGRARPAGGRRSDQHAERAVRVWQWNPRRYVRDLTVGEQQRVEIVKALLPFGGEILILDEPTAVLTPQGSRRSICLSCAVSSRKASPLSS